MSLFSFGSRQLDLSVPHIMGVLNTTPDSFSDGGQFYLRGSLDVTRILEHAQQMVQDGATVIDVGGESTRPGATPVSLEEERRRVLPVIEALASEIDAVISVDTSSPAIMREAAALGAGLINDVRALQRENAVAAAAATDLPVCLMHMQGSPGTMQAEANYEDIVAEVCGFLRDRMDACSAAGIDPSRVLLDPGFGFGKHDQHNIALLRGLRQVEQLGRPVLVGLSRKSMIGRLLGRPVNDRLAGSLALAMLAVQNGASILRVHDVAATRDMVEMNQYVTGKLAPIQ